MDTLLEEKMSTNSNSSCLKLHTGNQSLICLTKFSAAYYLVIQLYV